MLRLEVTPEQVGGSAQRLRGISGHIDELRSGLSAHADAGAQTIGAGTVQQSFGMWSEALPAFGGAADALMRSMACAASGYRLTDDGVVVAASRMPGTSTR
jgi:hypothetical protein